tara:strand:+ start:14431 stop:14628 length:198 start_codon:yes stop_codon:yes gene_type:complete
MSVFIHNTIFVIQNGVKRNEESIENQCGSSFVGMTELLCFQTYDKLRTFNKKFKNLPAKTINITV